VVHDQCLVVCVGQRQLLGAEFQWSDQGWSIRAPPLALDAVEERDTAGLTRATALRLRRLRRLYDVDAAALAAPGRPAAAVRTSRPPRWPRPRFCWADRPRTCWPRPGSMWPATAAPCRLRAGPRWRSRSTPKRWCAVGPAGRCCRESGRATSRRPT
jgi:hypothetical protein